MPTIKDGVEYWGAVGPYSYLLLTDGTNYWAVDHWGNRIYGPSTNFVADILNNVVGPRRRICFGHDADFHFEANATISSANAMGLELYALNGVRLINDLAGAGTMLTVGTAGATGDCYGFKMNNFQLCNSNVAANLTNLLVITNHQMMTLANLRFFGAVASDWYGDAWTNIAGVALIIEDVLNGTVDNVFLQTLDEGIRVTNNYQPHGQATELRNVEGYNIPANGIGINFLAHFRAGGQDFIDLPKATYCSMTGNATAIPAGSVGYKISADNVNARVYEALFDHCDAEGLADGYYAEYVRSLDIRDCKINTCTDGIDLQATAEHVKIIRPRWHGTTATGINIANGAGPIEILDPMYIRTAPTNMIVNAGGSAVFAHDDYEYQEQADAAWVVPGGPTYEGRTVVVYNTHANQAGAPYRKYSYANGGWRYVGLT